MARILQGHAAEYVERVRDLFKEYEVSLGIKLCFQNFAKELAELPGEYAPPSGRLLLALEGSELAGCVALRKIDDATCEMKRLYLRPAYRGKGMARLMATAAVEEARKIGYAKMRLDTLPSMKEAIALYQSLGFRPVAPYRHNPIEGTLYMELDLHP